MADNNGGREAQCGTTSGRSVGQSGSLSDRRRRCRRCVSIDVLDGQREVAASQGGVEMVQCRRGAV